MQKKAKIKILAETSVNYTSFYYRPQPNTGWPIFLYQNKT